MEGENEEMNIESNATSSGGVVFEDNYSSQYSGEESSKMLKLVYKLSGGLIKDEKTAEYVLLFCAILFFGLAVYFFIFGFGSSSSLPKNINPKDYLPQGLRG